MQRLVLPVAARLLGPLRRARRAPRREPITAWPIGPGTYAGTAQVLGVDAQGRAVARLADGLGTETTVEWALPFRYQPAPGDQLVVIGRAGRHWAIGVRLGRGRSELAFRGSIALAAKGALRLRADRGVRLLGKVISLRAGRLEVAVRALEERAGSVLRVVEGTLEELAGSVLRLTAGEEAVIAKDVTIMAEELVKMDGDPVQVS